MQANPPFLRIIKGVAIGTMHFHIAQIKTSFEDNFVLQLDGPTEKFGMN